MKIQMKTIASEYNEETGISRVTLWTDLGCFEGVAKLHPDDKETASHFAGCRYAEMRAMIKYGKMKMKVIDNQLDVLKKIANELKSKKLYKDNSYGVKLLEKNIYVLADEKETYKGYVSNLQKKLADDIKARDELIKSKQSK